MKDLKKWILLLYDLYWLRFKKPGEQWYELTDYLRKKLRNDGILINYTKDDLIAFIKTTGLKISMKAYVEKKDPKLTMTLEEAKTVANNECKR